LLDPDAARELELVAVQGSSAASVADRLGTKLEDTEIRLVRSLRAIGATPPTDHDQRIAEYLFSELPVAERDAIAHDLWTDGVDPTDLHHLEHTLEELRWVSKGTWTQVTLSAGDQPAALSRISNK
jgi:hypothetical protein